MIIPFPQNRTQALLDRLQCSMVERWTAVAESASSAITTRFDHPEAALAVLEARRAYIADAAGQKVDLWLSVVQAYVGPDVRDAYIAAAYSALQRVSEQTGEAARRQLCAFLMLISAALRLAGWEFGQRRDASPPAAQPRAPSAADLFVMARQTSATTLDYCAHRSPAILQLTGLTGRRYLLPLPRSAFPAACR